MSNFEQKWQQGNDWVSRGPKRPEPNLAHQALEKVQPDIKDLLPHTKLAENKYFVPSSNLIVSLATQGNPAIALEILEACPVYKTEPEAEAALKDLTENPEIIDFAKRGKITTRITEFIQEQAARLTPQQMMILSGICVPILVFMLLACDDGPRSIPVYDDGPKSQITGYIASGVIVNVTGQCREDGRFLQTDFDLNNDGHPDYINKDNLVDENKWGNLAMVNCLKTTPIADEAAIIPPASAEQLGPVSIDVYEPKILLEPNQPTKITVKIGEQILAIENISQQPGQIELNVEYIASVLGRLAELEGPVQYLPFTLVIDGNERDGYVTKKNVEAYTNAGDLGGIPIGVIKPPSAFLPKGWDAQTSNRPIIIFAPRSEFPRCLSEFYTLYQLSKGADVSNPKIATKLKKHFKDNVLPKFADLTYQPYQLQTQPQTEITYPKSPFPTLENNSSKPSVKIIYYPMGNATLGAPYSWGGINFPAGGIYSCFQGSDGTNYIQYNDQMIPVIR